MRGLGWIARPRIAPSPRRTLYREGSASLVHFPRPHGGSGAPPVLLVPSLINRWYVLDLRPGASLVEALTAAGLDVYLIDWGVPGDEDRYLTWDDVLARLARAVRRTLCAARAARVSLVGYCMGGTLAAIQAALEPDRVAGLVDLLGPIDFAHGGALRRMVDRRWFDADAIADAGNVSPYQMQAGFAALRPTLDLGKLIGLVDLAAADPAAREAFAALETWASDNIPFPAAAYRTYLGELYQDNALAAGHHTALGRTVDLSAIHCPVLTIVADRDTICPPSAALALCDLVSSARRDVLTVPGGHVGAVVGTRAKASVHAPLAAWLKGLDGRAPSAP
jgi:polyhydroxyalkanoate synthase subunit PhaC